MGMMRDFDDKQILESGWRVGSAKTTSGENVVRVAPVAPAQCVISRRRGVHVVSQKPDESFQSFFVSQLSRHAAT
jgi:hypothetical protein